MRLLDAMAQARREEGFVMGDENDLAEDRLYRDHNELRHSYGSVLKHFRAHANSLTLFTSDFPASHSDAYIQEIIDTHADGFCLSADEDDGGEDNDADEYECDKQLKDVNAGVSRRVDILEGMEFRLGSKLARLSLKAREWVEGISSWAMGPAMRLGPALLVGRSPDPTHIAPAGERGSLFAFNTLLSARCGWHRRPYMQHVLKALSRTLLAEVAEIQSTEMRVLRTFHWRPKLSARLRGAMFAGSAGPGIDVGCFKPLDMFIDLVCNRDVHTDPSNPFRYGLNTHIDYWLKLRDPPVAPRRRRPWLMKSKG
ncbi:hypothetical protein HWV62_39972 [Athelia sp. TMB]|nr:hypothetical protein HWV62_39972 [Athelia sp. TMB]